MTIKKQLIQLKENWLIILIIAAVILFLNTGNISIPESMESLSMARGGMAMDTATSYYPGPGYNEDFAPVISERIITKSASLSTEVKRGTFQEAEIKLKGIVTSSGAILLSENVNKQGNKIRSYLQGSYQIKVDTTKYDAVIAQLSEIGEVQYFNENTDDITGGYTNTETELEVEKARLVRYQQIYQQAETSKDKLDISDRIFEQERRIKYLEDSLKNMDQRVDYSSIYFTVAEKQSAYADIALVKLSSLVRSLVQSINGLLSLIATLIPWVIAVLIAVFAWRWVRKR